MHVQPAQLFLEAARILVARLLAAVAIPICVGLSFQVIASAAPVPQGAQNASTEPAGNGQVDFGREVLPILLSHCYDCHGPDQQLSNFRLDQRQAAQAGGDWGEDPIVPGQPEQSLLYRAAAHLEEDLEMPPVETGTRLDPSQLDILRRWIEQGANWPDRYSGENGLVIATNHWSFQPLADVTPPQMVAGGSDRPQLGPIDRFIENRLQAVGLEMSPPAARAERFRRLKLVMHGLLPEPAELDAFVTNDSPTAWEQAVDEALASEHYGQRWASHWLDVVRFGESTGYEVNRDRPNAWYYRDYVIDALNGDKPYNQFVVEQLAGDQVNADPATGFLVGGPYDIVKSPDVKLTLMQRQDELADYVNTASTTFLALTVACARCHNHKFDPILQKDYYALQAVFAGVEHGERRLPEAAPPNIAQSLADARSQQEQLQAQIEEMSQAATPLATPALPAVQADGNEDRFDKVAARWIRFRILLTHRGEPCIDELEVFDAEGNNVALASRGAQVTSSGDYQGDPKHQLAHINDGNYGNAHSWIANTTGECWVQIELPETRQIAKVVWARDREQVFSDRLPLAYAIEISTDGNSWTQVSSSAGRKPFPGSGQPVVEAQLANLLLSAPEQAAELRIRWLQLKQQLQELENQIPQAYVGKFKTPESIYRLHRGDPLQPREEVGPDTLTVMGTLELDKSASEADRRMALARWIADPKNPLTARVIVNRVWQHHFGRGLVATPSDFGVNGARPTHPQLLDWLARDFIDHGWSLKRLHKQILMSSVWQQSSRPRAAALRIDADCAGLWRFPPRRMQAEAIRDSILQVAGNLNEEAGGPGFLLFDVDHENVHHYFPLEKFSPDTYRRMVYMTKIRQEQVDVFGVFDCPDGGQTIPQRSRSTTPLQSLSLLNSPFIMEQAAALADRLESEAPDHPARQIQSAFLRLYGRLPTAAETADAVGFIEEYGLRAFCRALLNSNEFLFIS